MLYNSYSIGQKTCAEAKICIVTSNSCSYVNKGRICVKFRHVLHKVRTEGGGAKRTSFVVTSDSFTPLNIRQISTILRFLKMAPRDKAKKFTPLKIEEKARIMAWKEEGISSETIAQRLGRHRSSIDRLINRARGLKDGQIPERMGGSGRPRKVSKLVRGVIRRQIAKYPMMTAADLKSSLPELEDISERSIRRVIFKDLKMPSRSAAQKPLLTAAMKKKRLAFAKKYKDLTPDQWSRVMFSDESTFRCIRATKTKVRRPMGSDRYDSRYTVKNSEASREPDGLGQFFWCCWTWRHLLPA
jgi:transposase